MLFDLGAMVHLWSNGGIPRSVRGLMTRVGITGRSRLHAARRGGRYYDLKYP